MGEQVVVVGAGVGGLSAALTLAARGLDVTLVERAAAPGGKMRTVGVEGVEIDAGPSVFTMRWVFDRMFDEAGLALDDHVTLTRANLLARHAWDDARLDLFADFERSVDAVGAFAGAAGARGFTNFARQAAAIHRTLEASYIDAEAIGPLGLVARLGVGRAAEMLAIRPHESLWRALGRHFADTRLRQLFGRYATYCGSSPFLAPATLMLVAHVEMAGVWLVEGGMNRFAQGFAAAARAKGARLRFQTEVTGIVVGQRGVEGVELAGGELIPATRVVVNADPSAIALGRFGADVRRGAAAIPRADRSLSALVWTLRANAQDFSLARHTVFFSSDYRAEFAELAAGHLPADPTAYVCAQDRDEAGQGVPARERLQIIVNAPASGDTGGPTHMEIERCETAMLRRLAASGLTLGQRAGTLTGPAEFEALFPSTGGALYGRASHGWAAAFRRPAARTPIPGLYLAGGATHPGAGVPMAALSGRLAANALTRDLALTSRSARTATPGGISTRRATTAATG